MKVLWIPHTGWHIPQRAQLFCRRLVERHEIHVTNWMGDFGALRDYLSVRYVQNYVYRRYDDDGITVHHIPRISPALPVRTLRRLNQHIFSVIVHRIIASMCIDVVVGTFPVPPPPAPRLIFDLFDDNVSFWQKRMPAYAAEIDTVERAYLARADVTVAVSSVLADRARARNGRCCISLIPNGVDLSLFQGIDREAVRQNLALRGLVVASVGNHDNLKELEKILDTAHILQGRPITFLVAGRGMAVGPAKQQAAARSLSNVRFLGYLSQQEAVAVTCAVDVGICPYEKSAMDDARSPLRLLMYLAAGIPAVCTELEEVRRLQMPVVLVEDSAVALAQGIEQALVLPRERPPEIEAYDIDHLVDQYETVLVGKA